MHFIDPCNGFFLNSNPSVWTKITEQQPGQTGQRQVRIVCFIDWWNMVDMRRRRQFDRCNRYICKWFFDLRLFFLTFCYCLLSNWAPILNCGSHTWTKGSMFDRKIRVENIDARTISDPLPCSANMGGWVKTRLCPNQINIRLVGCFQSCRFPCMGGENQPIDLRWDVRTIRVGLDLTQLTLGRATNRGGLVLEFSLNESKQTAAGSLSLKARADLVSTSTQLPLNDPYNTCYVPIYT